jgi:hypothetical protein
MKDSTREISPLRQRMLEDMRLRKLAPHTQAGYVRAVRKLAGYLRRPPDTATVEDLRNFQLHLVDQGNLAHYAQRNDHRIEVFLRCDARSQRVDVEDEAGICAANIAGRIEPGGSQFAHRGDQEP